MADTDTPKVTIPDASADHAAERPTLLERLKSWPRYEPESADRDAERDRWRDAVNLRRHEERARRVLFIHGQLPGETGSGVYLQNIVRESIRMGIDMHVLSAGYDILDETHLTGVPPERIHTCLFTPPGDTPVPDAVSTPISGMSVVMPYPVIAYRDRTEDELLDWLTVFGNRIADLIDRLQPDVVHVNHLWFLNGLVRLAAPWIPLVASAHGTAYKLIKDTPRLRDLVLPTVRSADHVCAISPESVQECVKMFELPESRISIEGYGYEPELFHYRTVDRFQVIRDILGYDLSPADHLAVTVGKFVDWKGFKEFARAIGRLRGQGRNLVGIIVGEGSPESRADLETFLADQGLDDVVLLPGKVPREALPDIYRSADVYVLPSHVEPFGLVLMEALACGTPAVSGDVGGPPHYVPGQLREECLAVLVGPIATGENGEITETARHVYSRNLAEGMATVLEAGITERSRMRIAEAMKHLRWDRLVRNLSDIYDRLAPGRPPRDF